LPDSTRSSSGPIALDTAVTYLLACGLITPTPVLAKQISVTAIPRRNRNFIARIGDDFGFVIKQSEPTVSGGGTANTLRAEAQFYQRLHDVPQAELATRVPKLVFYDDDRVTLILQFLAEHETLVEHCNGLATQRFPISLWRRLGQAVAAIHDSPLALVPHGSGEQQGGLPAVFGSHRPPLAMLRTLSPAALQVLTIVQSSPAIRGGLDEAVASWKASTLIHGDLRTENILYSSPSDFRFVDWELCGVGNPTWDVASVAADIVGFWLRAAFPKGVAGTEGDVDDGSWSVFQAAIRSFWYGYLATRVAGASIRPEEFASYAAIRMLQTAFESCVTRAVLPRIVVLLLQVCENIMANPLSAADEFFAVTAPDLNAAQ
jgi:tRNA A-37 threonylcarbamoyl transferase component Bud32